MLTRCLPWPFASVVLLAACDSRAAEGVPAAGPTLTNLGLVAEPGELAGDGDLWLVAAREFEAGGRDLDGDGDAFDQVVYAVDLASGTSKNTFLALPAFGPLVVSGTVAAFTASEAAGGGRDLDGDGDAFDEVLHVHDGRTRTTRSLGLAVPPRTPPLVEGELVAFLVSEAAQGHLDLDGDGAADDEVLHVADRAAGTLVNTGLAPRTPLFLAGGRVAYFARESGADLNGDGDTRDLVLQVFDLETLTNLNSGLASDGREPLAADGTWLVAVPEAAQGARDLDGDGRVEDVVLHVFDPRDGFVRNLRVACPDPACAVASRPLNGRQSFALLADESAGDRNGDGDLLDLVPLLYDPRLDRLSSTGLAARPPLVFSGPALGFLALEAGQGTDLDGDGQLADAVAFLAELPLGRATNLRQAALDLRGSEDFLLLARQESAAGEDWNLDGDQGDVVVHAFERDTGRTINTRLASVDVFGASAREILLYASEAAEGRDLNGDRDLVDEVFVLFDVARAESRSLNLAGGADEARFASFTRSGRLVLLANELAQGADLDADGDLFDQVFHRGD